MSFRTIKLAWARKLMRAKYFVILTDKESVIALDGVNPHSFQDMVALAAQTAEVEEFYRKLGDLARVHRSAVRQLEEISGGVKRQKVTTTKNQPTKDRALKKS